jgi:hypothetical protein
VANRHALEKGNWHTYFFVTIGEGKENDHDGPKHQDGGKRWYSDAAMLVS